MTAKEQGLPEAVKRAFAVLTYQAGRLRDNYGMAGTAANIEEASDTILAALASDTGERGVEWFNHCDKVVPEALRYLAENVRPGGGCERFNSEHLHQLAHEIEVSAKRFAALRAQPAGGGERKPNHRWLPTDVLGNPMREYAPGKWEAATWPSDTPPESGGQGVAALALHPDGCYIIRYADKDEGDDFFAGSGALGFALHRYEQRSMAWTCQLYAMVACSGYGPGPQPVAKVVTHPPAQASGAVTQWPDFETMVDRMAKHAAIRESRGFRTIEEAVHHQSKWPRLRDEARELLTAALAQGGGNGR